MEFFRNIFAWLLEPFRLTNRTNLKASLACLLFAVIFWFFNELGHQHSAILLYAVDFEHKLHTHKNTHFLDNHKNIEVTVSGTGWRILHEQLHTQYMWKETIIYPLSHQKEHQNNNENTSQDTILSRKKYVFADDFRPLLVGKFAKKLNIIQIKPDTFYLD